MEKRVYMSMPILLIACFTILACSEKDEARAIRDLIDTGKSLAEAHDISGLIELTTEDVRAMPMDLDRKHIRGILWRTFKYYGPIKILYPRPKIEFSDPDDQASARFPFLIVKKEQTIPGLDQLRDDPAAWLDAIGENADLYRLSLDVIKENGNWRVRRTVLERFTGNGFDT